MGFQVNTVLAMGFGLILAAGAVQGQTCATSDDLTKMGIEVSQQGGVVYLVEPALLNASLIGATLTKGSVADMWRQNVSYENGFHVNRANEAVARALMPDATANVAPGSTLSVEMSAPSGLAPLAGHNWSGTLTATLHGQDAATNRAVTAAPVTVDASYAFLAETETRIGTCHYRTIPIEFAASHDGKPLLKRRSLYFPDLQITVMTIWGPDAEGPRVRMGILAMGPPG